MSEIDQGSVCPPLTIQSAEKFPTDTIKLEDSEDLFAEIEDEDSGPVENDICQFSERNNFPNTSLSSSKPDFFQDIKIEIVDFELDGEPKKSKSDDDRSSHFCNITLQKSLPLGINDKCSKPEFSSDANETKVQKKSSEESTNEKSPAKKSSEVARETKVQRKSSEEFGDDKESLEIGEMLEWFDRCIMFNCNQCEKSYITKSGLYNHQATMHHSIKHKCDQCDKEYNSKASLLDHQNSKHGSIKYKCDLCDKKYSTKNVLKDHKRNKHSGLSFSCNYCGKIFSSKEGYAYHKNVPCKFKADGLGEEFVCKTCNKSCPSKQALWNHERIVHKGKRYNCKECGKEYNYSSVLKNHIQSVHQGISHQCEICLKTFAQKSGLKVHMKKLH